MKLSEFHRAVDEQFGSAYGNSLLADLTLGDLDGKTAVVALDTGVAARDVWVALCRETGVPHTRWYGAGRSDPPR